MFRVEAKRAERQTLSNCPPGGGCACICNCGRSGTNCPPCYIFREFNEQVVPNKSKRQLTFPSIPPGIGTNFTTNCFSLIRGSANLSAGQLIGLLLTTLLSNLVMPILQIVLTGNNTVEGAVIPLANILCYILGIVLLLLRSLGLLGLLGFNGLLQNILGGGIG